MPPISTGGAHPAAGQLKLAVRQTGELLDAYAGQLTYAPLQQDGFSHGPI